MHFYFHLFYTISHILAVFFLVLHDKKHLIFFYSEFENVTTYYTSIANSYTSQ